LTGQVLKAAKVEWTKQINQSSLHHFADLKPGLGNIKAFSSCASPHPRQEKKYTFARVRKKLGRPLKQRDADNHGPTTDRGLHDLAARQVAYHRLSKELLLLDSYLPELSETHFTAPHLLLDLQLGDPKPKPKRPDVPLEKSKGYLRSHSLTERRCLLQGGKQKERRRVSKLFPQIVARKTEVPGHLQRVPEARANEVVTLARQATLDNGLHKDPTPNMNKTQREGKQGKVGAPVSIFRSTMQRAQRGVGKLERLEFYRRERKIRFAPSTELQSPAPDPDPNPIIDPHELTLPSKKHPAPAQIAHEMDMEFKRRTK
jgi:hypothetical protein